MINVIKSRLFQGHRTIRYPAAPAPKMPEKFAGRPFVDTDKWDSATAEICKKVCPTGAISETHENGQSQPVLDTGKCIFCRACERSCQRKPISFTSEYRLASTSRENLIIGSHHNTPEKSFPRIFRKSLKLRQVSAGGCNACEADTNVLNTLAWDLGRFGIQFVASPRHADGLLVTGPVSQHMRKALLKTYDAVPSPKIVIAVGSCAISGGPYIQHDEVCNGVSDLLPVDLFIPGCPPHPLTILDGLLRVINHKHLKI